MLQPHFNYYSLNKFKQNRFYLFTRDNKLSNKRADRFICNVGWISLLYDEEMIYSPDLLLHNFTELYLEPWSRAVIIGVVWLLIFIFSPGPTSEETPPPSPPPQNPENKDEKPVEPDTKVRKKKIRKNPRIELTVEVKDFYR